MRHRGKRSPLWIAGAGIVAFFMLALLVLLTGAETLAQDTPPDEVVAEAANGEELVLEDNGVVDVPEKGPDSLDQLDGLTALEYWHLLGAFLPNVVAVVIQRGWTKRAQATAAVATYFLFALIGEVLKGTFDTLTWDTPTLVLASAMKVAGAGYVAYNVLWRAFPLPDLIEEKTGGDPVGPR
jgi:hypothetical protein